MPLASPAPPVPGSATGRLPIPPGLVDRVNRDDSTLYRQERQLLWLAIDTARRFLSQKVVPALRQSATAKEGTR
jgi:hypothetical protein